LDGILPAAPLLAEDLVQHKGIAAAQISRRLVSEGLQGGGHRGAHIGQDGEPLQLVAVAAAWIHGRQCRWCDRAHGKARWRGHRACAGSRWGRSC
jgi:hypothetical protein